MIFFFYIYGFQISPEDIVGPPRPGRKLIVCGDSNYSDELLKIGLNADVLIHEATLQNCCKDTALQNGHSTPGMNKRSTNVILFYIVHRSIESD